jgi:hypothetical protein
MPSLIKFVPQKSEMPHFIHEVYINGISQKSHKLYLKYLAIMRITLGLDV